MESPYNDLEVVLSAPDKLIDDIVKEMDEDIMKNCFDVEDSKNWSEELEVNRVSFYRFPAMAGIPLWTKADQMAKIVDEAREASRDLALHDHAARFYGFESKETGDLLDNYAVELMDVIHACETALRMLKLDDNELEATRAYVILKNRKRGYYEQG